MGATDLDDWHPGLGFDIQGLHQCIERRQTILELLGRGNVDGGRDIISGLRPIDVVIRIRGVTAEASRAETPDC